MCPSFWLQYESASMTWCLSVTACSRGDKVCRSMTESGHGCWVVWSDTLMCEDITLVFHVTMWGLP